MIRTTLLCAGVLASPALADGRADYRAALQDASANNQAEYQAFYDAVGSGTYGIGKLESDAELLRSTENGGDIVLRPELVAIYDEETRTCTMGYDTDAYAKLPRTAILAVRDHALAQGWPENAIAPTEGRAGDCISRALLASTLGDLVFIDGLTFASHTVYLGFPDLGAGS